MITTIISAIILGLIIGAVARLLMPGKQDISIVMTIVIGIIASLVANFICYQLFGYSGNGGIRWIPDIVGVVVAIICIGIYGSMRGRRRVAR